MTRSMTGFATRRGGAHGWSWSWDLRSVNGRGLDLRLRLPEGIEGLEAAARQALGRVASRGNVTLTLRLGRDRRAGSWRLDAGAVREVLDRLAGIEAAAREAGLALTPASAGDLLAQRGGAEADERPEDVVGLAEVLIADLPALVEAFDATRRAEGVGIEALLAGLLDAIAAETDRAEAAVAARDAGTPDVLRAALDRITGATDAVDEARLAQELALIAIKGDVAEEIARLRAHIATARALVEAEGPKGRKLDFLTQELNREANTLCAKAGDLAVTQAGLELKALIDRLREQVQNVE